MGTRFLVFHRTEPTGNEVRMSPSAYYIDAEYEAVSVRVYAETAPLREAKFDIFDDGVSIFTERGSASVHRTSGVISTVGAGTSAILPVGENSDEMAEDFVDTHIEKGSWVWCNLVDAGGGKNFTVQLELHQVSEDEEIED